MTLALPACGHATAFVLQAGAQALQSTTATTLRVACHVVAATEVVMARNAPTPAQSRALLQLRVIREHLTQAHALASALQTEGENHG